MIKGRASTMPANGDVNPHDVAAEIHIFENGAHGVGLDLEYPAVGFWPTLLKSALPRISPKT